MPKTVHPEFHKALLDQSLYPAAPRRIKFEETRFSYLYKTGVHVYKIRKPGPHYSSLAIKEAYLANALRLGKRWAGENVEAVVPVLQTASGFALHGEGVAVDYALRMKQLPPHFFANELAAAGKLTPAIVARVARFLAEKHAAHPVPDQLSAHAGRPEHFRDLFEEIAYQVKKYVGLALSDAVYDMIRRPVEHFVDGERKLFLRRLKRQRVVECHGAFSPDHVHVKGKEVAAVSALESGAKFSQLDAAADVASFCNGLKSAGAAEAEALFVKRYASAAKDRDLTRVLPVYEVLQAMRAGLELCEWRVELAGEEERQLELARKAHDQFNVAVQRAREVPKPE